MKTKRLGTRLKRIGNVLKKHRLAFLRFIIALVVVGIATIGAIFIYGKLHEPETNASVAATLHSDGVTWLAGLTELKSLNESEETSYLQLASNVQNLKTTRETFRKSLEEVKKEEQYQQSAEQLGQTAKQIEATTTNVLDRYSLYEKALNYDFTEDVGTLSSGDEATARLDRTEKALTTIQRGESLGPEGSGNVTVTASLPDEVKQAIQKSLACVATLKKTQGSLESQAKKCQEQYKQAKATMITDIQGQADADQAYATFAKALEPFLGKN